jgi:hypothetical protein
MLLPTWPIVQVATRRIEKGEVVLSVPANILMSTDTAMQDEEVAQRMLAPLDPLHIPTLHSLCFPLILFFIHKGVFTSNFSVPLDNGPILHLRFPLSTFTTLTFCTPSSTLRPFPLTRYQRWSC